MRLLGLLVALVVVACGPADSSGASPSSGPSGIRGTVLLGPTCPGPADPEATGEPCTTPYAAELAIVDGDGKLVTRVTTAADGRFQVDLPPGDYTIAPKNGDPYPTAPSQSVSVESGQYLTVQINYDSGIR
jgi:hypothetical protein